MNLRLTFNRFKVSHTTVFKHYLIMLLLVIVRWHININVKNTVEF